MKILKIILLPVMTLLMVPWGAGAAAAETYAIDPVHSSVIFKIQHLGASYFFGRFNNPSGTVQFDGEKSGNGKIDVKVSVAQIDTANKKRDTHLKSSEFFNLEKFPEIRFNSKSVQQQADGTYRVEGDLTLLGKTRRIVTTARHVGTAKDPWGGYRAGFESRFQIKRSDYGMNFMQGLLGDEVEIIVSIEGIRKP